MSQALSLANLQLAMSENNNKIKEWVIAQGSVNKTLEIKWVNELPIEDISTSTIYMVKSAESTEENNIYAEYVYNETDGWEMLGTYEAGSVDLSEYYTSSQIDEMFSNFITIENYTDEEITEMVNGIWSE